MTSDKNYYQSTASAALNTTSLEGDIQAQVCVIGGGYSGVNVALELAESGVDVVLLEARDIGWGGSGRNGGQVICGIGHDPQTVRKQLSAADFDSLYSMGLEAVKILQQRIEKYDIECDFKWGYCTVAYDKKRLAMLEEAQAYLKARRYPFQTHLLEGQALHSVVVSDRYVGGLLDQGSAHLNPLKLVQGEARAAQSAGVRIFSNTPVRGVEKGSQVVVRTANGTVRADKLVYACNAYLEGLDSYLQRHFVTTNAFSIATKALPESLIREILPGGAAVCDNRPVIDYYRISADNRLLFGGATHYLEYLPGDLAAHLRRNLRKVFPQLADVEIEYSWSGKMAIGANLFPQVGMLPGTDNIYYAQAYAGFGLGPSHLVARALRQQILGEKGEYEVLAAIKHPKIMASQRLNPLWVSAGKCWHQLHSLLP